VVCFFQVLTPFTLVGHNFLICNLFSTIVSVSNVPREGFKFCLDTRNNIVLPMDPACPEHLSVRWLASLPYKTMSSIKPSVKYMDTRSGKTKIHGQIPLHSFIFRVQSSNLFPSFLFKLQPSRFEFGAHAIATFNMDALKCILLKVFLCFVIHMYVKGICILGKHRYFVPNLLPAQHV
jgi:hypothetical protein